MPLPVPAPGLVACSLINNIQPLINTIFQVGSVSIKNTKNILIKNIGDASIGAVCWWIAGFGVAFGESSGTCLPTLTSAVVVRVMMRICDSSSGESLVAVTQLLFMYVLFMYVNVKVLLLLHA